MQRHRPRVLVLSLTAAVGLMAFSAVAAEAANLGDGGKAAKFRVEGSSALAVGRTFVGGLEKWTDGLQHALFLVEGRNLTILCGESTIEEGKILTESEALARILFRKCATFNFKLTEKLPCTIKEEEIIIVALLLTKKHENELYLVLEGDPATSDLTVVAIEGEECPLPANNLMAGSLVALIKEGSTEQAEKLITFSEPIQLLFQERSGGLFIKGDRVLYGAGAIEAYLDANYRINLTGTHTNKTWSVI